MPKPERISYSERRGDRKIFFLRTLLAGLLMGLANAVPGVSGGTMAVVTGVFRRLVEALDDLLRLRVRRDSFLFLALLAVGLLLGLIVGSKALVFAFERYPYYTYAFFYGLVAFSLVTVARGLDRFRALEFAAGLFVVLLPAVLGRFEPSRSPGALKGGLVGGSVDPAGLLLTGVIVGASMILPGLSGSLVLMLLGLYHRAIGYVSELPNVTAEGLRFLATLGSGVLVGVWAMAKLLRAWFERGRNSILSFVIGLLTGSLYPMTPSFHGAGATLLMLVWVGVGGAIVTLLQRLRGDAEY